MTFRVRMKDIGVWKKRRALWFTYLGTYHGGDAKYRLYAWPGERYEEREVISTDEFSDRQFERRPVRYRHLEIVTRFMPARFCT